MIRASSVIPYGKSPTIYGIVQGEIGVTDAKSAHPALGTFGAGPCVIVALYNPKTTKTALSHIDAFSDLQQYIDLMLHQIQDEEGSHLQVHMATSFTEDNDTLDALKSIIKKNQKLSLEEIITASSLAIDARKGEIIKDVSHLKLILKDVDIKIKKRREMQSGFRVGKEIKGKIDFDGLSLSEPRPLGSVTGPAK